MDRARRWQAVRAAGAGTVFVALAGGDPVGYGAVDWLDDVDAGGPDTRGFYLSGLRVPPDRRRQGAGTRLTSARLDWVFARSDRCFYFANSRNAASIELHSRLGFETVARDVTVPGVTFEGGHSVLGRLLRSA